MFIQKSDGNSGRGLRILRNGIGAALLTCAATFALPGSASAETRSFVVSWFTHGMYSTEGDCGPQGVNPPIEIQWVTDLMDIGMTKEEAEKIVARTGNGDQKAHEIIVNRGRINGQPVNAYINPQSVPDPNMRAVVGTKGFGFNLDGKVGPNSFEDPESGEKGVDNEMFRSLGCIKNLRGNPPLRSSDTEQWWHLIQDYQPAWMMSISASNFTNDEHATMTFDRALEHASWDANSNTRPNMTYRIDADPRSHTVIHGVIKDKVFTAATDQTLYMVGDLLVMPILEVHKTHVRMKLLDDGSIDGFVGGYQPWKQVFFPIAAGGNAFEMNVAHDIPGIYYLLKKHADAEPDPKTGENTAISTTWRFEGVPAFAVPVDGKQKLQASNGSNGTNVTP